MNAGNIILIGAVGGATIGSILYFANEDPNQPVQINKLMTYITLTTLAIILLIIIIYIAIKTQRPNIAIPSGNATPLVNSLPHLKGLPTT